VQLTTANAVFEKAVHGGVGTSPTPIEDLARFKIDPHRLTSGLDSVRFRLNQTQSGIPSFTVISESSGEST